MLHVFAGTVSHVFSAPVCVFQDVCGAADTRQQPVDAGGAGRLRLLQAVPTNHHAAQGSQIYPLIVIWCGGHPHKPYFEVVSQP